MLGSGNWLKAHIANRTENGRPVLKWDYPFIHTLIRTFKCIQDRLANSSNRFTLLARPSVGDPDGSLVPTGWITLKSKEFRNQDKRCDLASKHIALCGCSVPGDGCLDVKCTSTSCFDH